VSYVSAQRVRGDEWAVAVRQINTILDVARLRSSVPLQVFDTPDAGGCDNKAIVSARPAFGPEDVAWDVAVWLSQHLAGDDFEALLGLSQDELAAGLDCDLYELDPHELFQTFIVFYLTSPNAVEPRRIAPGFLHAFETLLDATDRDLLVRLRRVRRICATYRLRHPG
jgi:hypothetical protein